MAESLPQTKKTAPLRAVSLKTSLPKEETTNPADILPAYLLLVRWILDGATPRKDSGFFGGIRRRNAAWATRPRADTATVQTCGNGMVCREAAPSGTHS